MTKKYTSNRQSRIQISLCLLFKLLLVVLGFFVVTFTMYFFNLDMKATAMVAPLLEKWYDRVERKQYI